MLFPAFCPALPFQSLESFVSFVFCIFASSYLPPDCSLYTASFFKRINSTFVKSNRILHLGSAPLLKRWHNGNSAVLGMSWETPRHLREGRRYEEQEVWKTWITVSHKHLVPLNGLLFCISFRHVVCTRRVSEIRWSGPLCQPRYWCLCINLLQQHPQKHGRGMWNSE